MRGPDDSEHPGGGMAPEAALAAITALEPLPPETQLPLHYVLPIMRALAEVRLSGTSAVRDDPLPAAPESWRTRLWTAPEEARIGISELCEAVGRPDSWAYKHTMKDAEDPIPHRKLDGRLVFVVGEVRCWLKDHEEVVRAGPMDTLPSTAMLLGVRRA